MCFYVCLSVSLFVRSFRFHPFVRLFVIIVFKVDLATKKGAIGIISFPNPSYTAPDGTSDDKTYPNGEWLSKDAVQLWSAYGSQYSGDRLTPGLPATKGIFRKPYNESRLPDIPAQPISYGQAKELLRRMKGKGILLHLRSDFTLPESNLRECFFGSADFSTSYHH